VISSERAGVEDSVAMTGTGVEDSVAMTGGSMTERRWSSKSIRHTFKRAQARPMQSEPYRAIVMRWSGGPR
jgi:hypothetical protein